MLRKKYNLKKLKKDISSISKPNINLLELLTEIGFDPRDIASMYKDLIGGKENFMKGKK